VKVLLVSPFSPLDDHDHAAADTVVHLASELGNRTELFVYSPTHTPSSTAAKDRSYTAVPASADTLAELGGNWTDYFGAKPAWLRRSWPTAANEDVGRYVDELRPDVVHVEYLQAAEVALRFSPSVITLHDVTESVMLRALAEARGVKRPHVLLEYMRTRKLERRVLRSDAQVIALSKPDGDVLESRARRSVKVVRIGVESPMTIWSPHVHREAPVLVFVGAMWRSANIVAAAYLAEEVMPLLWKDHPTASLRIVGSRPSQRVRHLAETDRRVEVTGFVRNLDEEFANADAVLAPTVLGGGVLLKLLRAMAVGCPVVTSTQCARAIEADSDMLWTADDAESVATSAKEILCSDDKGAGRGRRARTFVESAFSWSRCADSYCDIYSEVTRK
jgi:glycosyltransferase involved in cell wall biosynthesis